MAPATPAYSLQTLAAVERSDHPTLQNDPTPWLWPLVLPRDQLTLIAGPPGIGKSFLSLDIAARISRGHPMPFCPSVSVEPREVLLYAPEDSPANTIAPRLRTLGADLSRIHMVRSMRNSRPPAKSPNAPIEPDPLADALSALTAAAAQIPACGLIIIDPLAAFLGASASNAGHIRTALSKLALFARRKGIALLAIAHTQPARTAGHDRILGPAVLSVLPRTIWHLRPHGPSRALLPAKSIAAQPPSFTFTLDSRGLTWLESHAHLAPSLSLAESPLLDQAREFLKAELNAAPRPAKEILNLARNLGFSPNTLRRAGTSLRVASHKAAFNSDNQWLWALPAEDAQIRRAQMNTTHSPAVERSAHPEPSPHPGYATSSPAA